MKNALLRHKATLPLLVGLVMSTTLMNGCMSFALGEEEFSCPNGNKGVACTSTWDMYEQTNNGQIPNDGKETENNIKNDQAKNGESDFVLDNYVTNRLPNEPIPVRTPPQVMRIWVAPYEDKEGDFIMSGYVYTEVSPRRWTLGVNSQEMNNQNLFQPLEKK